MIIKKNHYSLIILDHHIQIEIHCTRNRIILQMQQINFKMKNQILKKISNKIILVKIIFLLYKREKLLIIVLMKNKNNNSNHM